MKTAATITIEVTVTDPRALRRAAWLRAKANGANACDHAQFRRDEGGIRADLVTLFDSRPSPPGCQIETIYARVA